MIEPCRFSCGTEIDYETRTFSDGLSIIIPWETNGVRGHPPAIYGYEEKTPTYKSLHNCPKLVVSDIRDFTPEMLMGEDGPMNSWRSYIETQDLHVDAPKKLKEYVVDQDPSSATCGQKIENPELKRLKQMSLEERYAEHYNGMLWEVANNLAGIEFNGGRNARKKLLIRCLHLFPHFFSPFAIFDNSQILDPPEDFDPGWIPPDFGSDGLLPRFRLEQDRFWYPLEFLAFFYELDGSIDDTLQCLSLQWYVEAMSGDKKRFAGFKHKIYDLQSQIQFEAMEQQESRAKQLDKYKPQLKRFAKFGLDVENLAVGITEEVIDQIIKDFERNDLRPFVLKYFPTSKDQVKKLKSMSWIHNQTIFDKAQHRRDKDRQEYLQDPNSTLLNFVDIKDLRTMVWGYKEHRKIPDYMFRALKEIGMFRNKGAPHPQNYPEEKQGLANLQIMIRVLQCQEYFQEMGPKAGLE